LNLKNLIRQIKTELKVTPKQKVEQLKRPSGHEYGFRHGNGPFFLVRDDSVIEANAGNETYVTVDGPGQNVTVKSSAITLEGRTIQFLAPPGEIYFGYQRLNPFWLTPNPLDVISPFAKAPLVQRFPGSLGQTRIEGLNVPGLGPLPIATATFLTGTPAPGQTLVPLDNFIRPEPLFGLNEQLLILHRNLGEMITSLAELGG
jgi:hypothetical protein